MEELCEASMIISETSINLKRPHEDEMKGTESFSKKFKPKQYSYSYPCTKCELVATTPSALSKHMSIHCSNQEFTCPLCDYSCKVKGGVKNHLRKFHTQHPSVEDNLGDAHHNVLEVFYSEDDREASFMNYNEANPLKNPAKMKGPTQQDVMLQPRTEKSEIHDDENHNLLQLTPDTLNKMKKSLEIKVVQIQLEIEVNFRLLETHKALFYRERTWRLMSRKVELILMASNLDKESAEFAEIKREEEQVEAELRDAVIKQSSFSSILEKFDRFGPETVRLIQADEFSELKNCVEALFLKFREANEQLDLIVKRKRALKEDKWMERFAKLD